MKQLALFFCLIILTIVSNGQTKNNNEIYADGTSRTKIRPDIALLTLSVEKTDSIEKKAIQNLNEEIEKLTNVVTKLGFDKSQITISDFEISSNQHDDERKKYTATNELKIEFALNTKLIDAFYQSIQENNLTDIDISFDTKLSDSLEKAARLNLVQQAINDAVQNATNIATTLKVKIGNVKQVIKNKDGFNGQAPRIEMIKFTPPRIVKDTEIKHNTSFDKFEVSQVEIEERITIVFEIKK